MKLKLSILIVFIASMIHAGESRLADGKIESAKATVNGVVCWTDIEKDSMMAVFNQFAATSPVVVENYALGNFEVTLGTSGIQWVNHSDYIAARDDKDYLTDKLDDLPESQKRKLRQSITYLRSENAKR